MVESCEEALSQINEVINEQKLNFVRLIFKQLKIEIKIKNIININNNKLN